MKKKDKIHENTQYSKSLSNFQRNAEFDSEIKVKLPKGLFIQMRFGRKPNGELMPLFTKSV